MDERHDPGVEAVAEGRADVEAGQLELERGWRDSLARRRTSRGAITAADRAVARVFAQIEQGK